MSADCIEGTCYAFVSHQLAMLMDDCTSLIGVCALWVPLVNLMSFGTFI